MHRRLRTLVVLALLLLSGGALAQGFGFGMGLDDLSRRVAAGPPAAIGNLLLVGGGNILLVGGGNLQCVGSC
jgi:hypothetical protein